MSDPCASLRLRLHGEPVLTLAESGRRFVLERRAAALLALAAFEPGVSRLRAAALLWPDSDDPRRNLRQQLLRFRRLAGRDLLAGGDALSLASQVDLERDAAGVLLGALDYADCEDFRAWLAQRRREEVQSRVAAARSRVAEAEAAGDLDAALSAAQTLLAIDRRDEMHHRECMRLHYQAGNMAAGLAVYAQLERMLADELGTRPSDATVQLCEALRAAQRGTAVAGLPFAPAARSSLPVTLKRPPAMVGRAAELAGVQQAWADDVAVWLEGEAGMGKSRLVGELIATAANERPVVVGAGRPGDAGSPYTTLARLLRARLAAAPPTLSPATQAALRHLGPTMPGATDRTLGSGAMAAAVQELLAHANVALVVVDDLHFADEATIDLLAALAAAPAEPDAPPLHWLFCCRPAEVPAAGRALRASLSELQRLAVVTLQPLKSGDVAALVDTLAIDGLQGASLAEAVLRHTGGNPLFVLETLKQGLVDGSLAHGRLPRPATVASLIEARLARLSEPALTLARVAAIAGVDFSVELAEAAIGVRAVALASAWQELQEAQILRDDAFAHDLVGDAVLRGVPPVVARRVHAQCAQWLQARGADPLRMARHWLAGGEPAQAGRAFVAAAGRAERAARLQEEMALYTQAAEAFAQAGLADERFDALCLRARALMGVDVGTAALDEVRALVATAASDEQRLRAGRELLGMLVERGQAAEAIEAGQAVMALARRHAHHDTLVRTACHLATALCRLGRADESLALLLPLREWVESQPDDALRLLWHGDWAATLGHLGRLREAVAAYELARAAAHRAGLRDAESRLMLNCAVTLRQSGQFDRALALAREGHALSDQDSDDAMHRAIARLVIARDECETGSYGPALAALEAVLPQFEALRASFWSQAARMVLATLWLQLGQPARAMPLLAHDEPDLPPWLQADRQLLRLDLAHALHKAPPVEALQAVAERAAIDPQRGPWLRVRALRHQAPAQALAEGGALSAELAGSERQGVLMALHVQLARAALAMADTQRAATLAEQIVARFDEGIAPDAVYRAEAWWIASQAFEAAGRRGDAASAMERGTQWIRQQALPNVPPAFIDSFLHRNPTNEGLLAAASRARVTAA